MAKKLSMKSPKKGPSKRASKLGGMMGLKGMPKSPKMPMQSVSGLARGGSKPKKSKKLSY